MSAPRPAEAGRPPWGSSKVAKPHLLESWLLSASGMSKSYGGVKALDGVSIEVQAGSITGLIGPNGSGKSTLFDCICGFQRSDAGVVTLAGESLQGLSAQAIARKGVRRTFQQLRVFPALSVRDNLLTSAQSAPGFGYVQELLRLPSVRAHERAMRERADAMLEEIRLTRLAQVLAGHLSYGQKKLLELGMALMTEPRLLLLDEPMAGVNPSLVEDLKAELQRVNDRGIALLIVEHNLKLVFDLSHQVYVLEQGRVLMKGTPRQVSNDERVMQAYLGVRQTAGAEQGGAID